MKIEKTSASKLAHVNFENLTFGSVFTDHMFVCAFENGAWQVPKIIPMGLIPTHPAAMALHYGQAIFEGMKATLDTHGTPMLRHYTQVQIHQLKAIADNDLGGRCTDSPFNARKNKSFLIIVFCL